MKKLCFAYFPKHTRTFIRTFICLVTFLFFFSANKNFQVYGEEITANNNGIKAPVLSKLMERDVRLPHTKQIVDGNLANLISIETEDALGAISILKNKITKISNPHDDLSDSLTRLFNEAEKGIVDKNEASGIMDILLGTTSGRIYDGFALLNFNRWNDSSIPSSAFPDDVTTGEYKTKKIRFSGKTERNFKKLAEDINLDLLDEDDDVTIWEVDVNMLWYGQQFDSDTFFIHIPIINAAKNIPSPDDTLRINYHIYSLIDEDFAPIQTLFDANPGVEFPGEGSVRLPHKGEDTVWTRIERNSVTHVTVQHSALRFLSGIYTWGWEEHPPRVHFLDFLTELTNAESEKNELDPKSQSRSIRNRELDINSIGNAAPEKKIYKIAKAVLDETITASELVAMLNDSNTEPAGIFTEWMDLMTNQLQLPPEVVDILESEGKSANDYDYIVVFMNNEMYGQGIFDRSIRSWQQGEIMHNRIFNLDNFTHYYRNVDFGPALNDDLTRNVFNGIFSFEIFNIKPTYGAPKVAEMQWRAGWGFRPHYSIIQQDGVFPRESDRKMLKPFVAPKFSEKQMAHYYGYQYSEENRQGDFIFTPLLSIIQSEKDNSFDYLYECPKSFSVRTLEFITNRWGIFKIFQPLTAVTEGLIIGQKTEGFGVAKMCDHINHAGMFCENDLSRLHPLNIRNVDTDLDGINDKLYFPTFLINPNKNGGDIIPPTTAWEPFLYLSPENGTIYIDPDDVKKGYWTDLTYAHGRPVYAMDNIEVNIEMPRASGQLFYQFDGLYHDNNIFSPHPFSSQR
ncbi:MAG: hypothetical protein ACUZ8E_08655 [Candidatus Anammoxibacter sp.]